MDWKTTVAYLFIMTLGGVLPLLGRSQARSQKEELCRKASNLTRKNATKTSAGKGFRPSLMRKEKGIKTSDEEKNSPTKLVLYI